MDEKETQPSQAKAAGSPSSSQQDDSGTGLVHHETMRLAPPAGREPISSGRRSTGQALLKNQVINGRYRIIRFIARGGMGEVYEAEDLEFSHAKGGEIERVALKTVRLDMAEDEESIQRFRLEILHSRKVSHPNVCRIFESGRHRLEPEVPGAPPNERLYFTMELLEGETLRIRLKRLGKMTPAQALPIVSQMAAGLSTAHAAGVVHRDFKSSNVFLVSSPAGERAVVTDFGLARGDVDESSLASLTGTGDTLGTAAYMAPEQIGGAKGAKATVDIYALGVVMYEMVTGAVPFTELVKKLTETPASPRTLTPNLDPVWERTILRCLERKPEDRFQSADDVIRALGGQPVALALNTEKRLYRVAAVGIAAALVAGYFLARQTREPQYGPGAADAPSSTAVAQKSVAIRRSVAVLGFDPPVGDTGNRWMSPALAEVLSAGLASGGQVRVISPLEVARLRADLGPSSLWEPTSDQSSRIKRGLAADFSLSGRFSFIGDGKDRMLKVEMRLSGGPAPAGGQTWTASGSEADVAEIAVRASQRARQELNLPKLLPAQETTLTALLPADPAARRSYSDAMDRLARGDVVAAQKLLETSISREPRHLGSQIALAGAWSLQGNQPRAAAVMAKALSSSESLPSDERALLEARAKEIDRDWKAAIAGYQSLLAAHPDDPYYLLALAEAQIKGAKYKEALAAIAEFRQSAQANSSDPRLDLLESRANYYVGDNPPALAAAARASQKGAALGSLRTVAEAKLLEGVGLDALGQAEKSQAATDQARQLFETAGDRSGVARALLRIGSSLMKRGDPKGAYRAFETALGHFRELGDRLGESRVLFSMGGAQLAQGKNDEAGRLYDQALGVALQIDAKLEAASALSNMGARLSGAGDLSGAQRRYQQALRLFTDMGENVRSALVLTNVGEIQLARGDINGSRQSHEESLSLNQQMAAADGIAYDKYRIAETLVQTGDLRAAETRYREALKGQPDATSAGETRLRLAALLVASGRATEGEKEAREAEEALRVAGAAETALWAKLVVADAECARNKLMEAGQDLERATAALKDGVDSRVRITAALVRARLAAALKDSGKMQSAMAEVEKERTAAAKDGRVLDEFELRLAAATLEAASGKAGASDRLKKLATEARARGLEGLAQRAESKAS